MCENRLKLIEKHLSFLYVDRIIVDPWLLNAGMPSCWLLYIVFSLLMKLQNCFVDEACVPNIVSV